MRILIAHEAAAGGGGVESYLAALMPALLSRGHELAFLHHNTSGEEGPTTLLHMHVPAASVVDDGLDGALRKMREWRPEVCFSHNMRVLDVDERLAAEWPTAKMLHGYFGTCVSGQKAHAFPRTAACSRHFGPGCLALYVPRRCGELRAGRMLSQYVWARRQRALFDRYAHVVVASQHMASEYIGHGVPASHVTVAPLFPTAGQIEPIRRIPPKPTVLFMGRMTSLKGCAVLAQAVADAQRLGHPAMQLLCAGEGPERARLEHLARRLGLTAVFPGWLTGSARTAAFRGATIVAVPSLWPEPFGLVGLEAAAHGVPAVAFDTGGIREWLHDGVNGRLIPANDVAMFSRVLADLAADPAEIARLGHGAQRIARRFSLDAHVAILESVFARIAGCRAAIA
jgi:glycosyltransferase involved in cell wall biosynthesis